MDRKWRQQVIDFFNEYSTRLPRIMAMKMSSLLLFFVVSYHKVMLHNKIYCTYMNVF